MIHLKTFNESQIKKYELIHKRNPNLVITFDVISNRISNIQKSVVSIRFPYHEGEHYSRNVEVWSKNNEYTFNGTDLSKSDNSKIMGIRKKDIPMDSPLRLIYKSKF